MRLSQLTGLRMDQLHAEYEELMQTIKDLQEILDNPERCKEVMKEELQEVKENMAMLVVPKLFQMNTSLMQKTFIQTTLLLLQLVILVI